MKLNIRTDGDWITLLSTDLTKKNKSRAKMLKSSMVGTIILTQLLVNYKLGLVNDLNDAFDKLFDLSEEES